MTTISTANTSLDLGTLADRVARTNKPLQIRVKNRACVLISGDAWRSMQETLYLKSIPGMWESIVEGQNATHEECFSLEDIGWTIK